MVKRTNLPKRGTTNDVGGMISASRRKNTVNDRRIDIAKLTCVAEESKSRRLLLTFLPYLFAGIGRQVEDENGEESDPDARNDEIDRVEQRLASHRDVERDVQVGLVAARVKLHVPSGTAGNIRGMSAGNNSHYGIPGSWNGQNVPLDRHVEFAEIDAHIDDRRSGLLLQVAQIHLITHVILAPCYEPKKIKRERR